MGAEKDPRSPGSAELRRLLDLEANRPDPPALFREHVRGELDRALRRSAGVPHRLPLGSGKLWVLFGGVAVAAVVWRSATLLRSHPRPAPAPPVVSIAPPVAATAPETPSEAVSPPKAAEVPALPHPKIARSDSLGGSFDTSLARERELIERARTTFRAGHPDVALGILRQHRREFPDGILVEERLGLQIQALAARGEMGTAEQLARDFRARFPQSPLLSTIDAALQRSPP